MKRREFFDRFVWVRKCVGCGQILDYDCCHDAFCDRCRLWWGSAKVESCERCNQSALECLCMPKSVVTQGAVCLCKLMFYDPANSQTPANKLIYRLKHNPNRRLAEHVARELSGAIETQLKILTISTDCAVIVSMPRSRRAKNHYGFDQSEQICRALSMENGIPYANVIRRRRGGKEQKKLDRRARFENIRQMFVIKKGQESQLQDKWILLFDDVVTSGASMAAGVHLVKKAGAAGVICLCVAQK